MPRIHATALVDPKAELAADVEVGAYSIVGPHVQVGAGTVIGPHVVLTGRTRLSRVDIRDLAADHERYELILVE